MFKKSINNSLFQCNLKMTVRWRLSYNFEFFLCKKNRQNERRFALCSLRINKISRIFFVICCKKFFLNNFETPSSVQKLVFDGFSNIVVYNSSTIF